MKYSESQEMYLSNIYDIYKSGEKIRLTDIALKMNVSKASVSRGVYKLIEDNFLEKEMYADINITDEGIKYAKQIQEKFQLLKKFLMKSLELTEAQASMDACRIEHIISKNTIEAIKDYLKK